MPRFPWRFIGTALALAWAVDLLFWKKIPGISFPIWILLVLLAVVILAKSEKSSFKLPSILLMAIAFLLACITAIRSEGFTRFVNGGLSLFTLGLLAATLCSGFWPLYRVPDYIRAFFNLLAGALTRLPKLLSSLPISSENTQFKRLLFSVLRGLVIALPVVIILGALLSSADPIFGDFIKEQLKFFDIHHLPEYLFRCFYIVIILAYPFGGILLHAILPDKEEIRPQPEKPLFKPFLGFIESAVVLFCIDFLFAFFVAFQFHYLFGGEANISATGYTYSEYARRGFGELVLVSIISLLIYLTLGNITRQENRKQERLFSAQAIALMALVLVILVSAFQRMALYEHAYGFTRLRTYTYIFIIWLSILLLASIVLEIIRKRFHFVIALLVTVMGFAITLGSLNIDGFIAAQNIQRAHTDDALDGEYLKRLSADAVPVLVKAYIARDLPKASQDRLGAELACRTALTNQQQEKQAWPSLHLAEINARQWLNVYRELWENKYPVTYQSDTEEWFVHYNDTEQPCRFSLD